MTAGRCTLELHVDGAWRVAAEVCCDDVSRGVQAPTRVEYDLDYLDAAGARALDARDHRAVSCRYPVGYGVHVEPSWPAFLLDVIPSGAARRFWEAQLDLPNVPASDWAILVAGGSNAPGNVRVLEASGALRDEPRPHPGFAREEVLERAETFIEHARERGASIAGGSGAGGDAPKLLLREDHDGRWHADAAVADARTARCWIVKLPRSSRAADRLVLEAEAPYYELARRLGARVAGPLSWEADCLFIPRFDRSVEGGRVARFGLESLCSLAGVAAFGAPIPKEDLAAALARFATDPARELRELVHRDVLDVALGNTDNHARNTAVLKRPDGTIALSPLYDFAPMVLDPQGIARVCRWAVEDGGYPDWGRVADALAPHGLDPRATRAWLRELGDAVGTLGPMMREVGVPDRVAAALAPRVARVARELKELR